MLRICATSGVLVLIVSILAWGNPAKAQPAQARDADAPPALPAEEQPEVLTRGPVHEAFAQPVDLEAQQGVIAPTQPPENIEEEPPAERPQGDNYVWVPGYWAWDQDRKGYIWISACWRAAPANMSWVPGYWSQAEGGWEWVAGFWTSADQKEIEYLPAPPELTDVAAPSEPTSPDQIWVPPCNYWSGGHYVLRRGYWLPAHEGWVWVPSHYVWTPRGYVFCEGHWDRTLERRGVLFAPVYIQPRVYTRVGFRFSPSIVVDTAVLSDSFFACPRYSHYYFGDYYDPSYVQIGIYPRYEVERIHTWYDPIYRYDRWRHRDDRGWEDRVRHDYEVRRDDRNLRPARTFREQEVRLAKLPEALRGRERLAQPLRTAVTSKQTTIKFEQINVETRRQIETRGTEAHKFQTQRRNWEAPTGRDRVATPSNDRTPAATPKETAVKPRDTTTPPRTEERRTPARNEEPKTTGRTEPKVSTPPRGEERRTEQPKTNTTPRSEERRTNARVEKTPVVPPRDVHRTEPERVKIPDRPVSGKSGASGGEKAPSAPGNERERSDRDGGRGK